MRTKSRRIAGIHRILTLGALNLAFVSPALGQTTTLQLSTIEAASIGGKQLEQTKSFADHWTGRALGLDAQQAARAQTKLLEPLIHDRVSISFRRAYSDALGAYFDQLASDGDIGSTLSALRLAGELGTSRGVAIILAGLEEGQDTGVQIFAAGRAGRVFRTTASNGSAMSSNDLSKLIETLDEVATWSENRSLASACIAALGQGCSLPSDEYLAERARSLEAMCTAASDQLLDEDSDLESRVRVAMTAAGTATNSVLQVGEDSTKDAIRAAVALGANMISIPLSDVINGTMPGVDGRDLYVALARSGESLLYFALREFAELNRRPVGGVEQTAFADLLQAGEDRSFRNKAALLLGPGSPIVTDFDFEDDQFVH